MSAKANAMIVVALTVRSIHLTQFLNMGFLPHLGAMFSSPGDTIWLNLTESMRP
jgi:hypothetical protein